MRLFGHRHERERYREDHQAWRYGTNGQWRSLKANHRRRIGSRRDVGSLLGDHFSAFRMGVRTFAVFRILAILNRIERRIWDPDRTLLLLKATHS
jgi:hypothetical protein